MYAGGGLKVVGRKSIDRGCARAYFALMDEHYDRFWTRQLVREVSLVVLTVAISYLFYLSMTHKLPELGDHRQLSKAIITTISPASPSPKGFYISPRVRGFALHQNPGPQTYEQRFKIG